MQVLQRKNGFSVFVGEFSVPLVLGDRYCYREPIGNLRTGSSPFSVLGIWFMLILGVNS